MAHIHDILSANIFHVELLTLILYILFSVRIFHGALLYSYLWQLKEYRMDRMMDLLSTPRGRGYFFNIFFVIQFSIVVAVFILRSDRTALEFLAYILFIVFLAQALRTSVEVFTRSIRRPKLTLKALGIFMIAVLSAFAITWYFLLPDVVEPDRFSLVLTLTLVSLILSDLVSISVFLFNLISEPLKRRTYRLAREKIDTMKDLTVIGITGSFGKTTTKEFLTRMLSEKFHVLATKGNTNTEMGVANEILKRLKPEHQIFIVEMGAYKKGEIKIICDMVHPKIGIITAVSNQHVGLFGSVNNIAEAKFELVESLPEDGLAIFNADDRIVMELSEKALCRKIFYSVDKEADVCANDVRMSQEGIGFTLKIDDIESPVVARIAGGHNASNILAAVCAAREMGLTLNDITHAISKLELPKHNFVLYRSGENVIIDSSYNTNQVGCEYAMMYLKKMFPDHTRVIVFPGILELGNVSRDIHTELGMFAAKTCHHLIISSDDFAEPLMNGFDYVAHGDQKSIVLTNPQSVAKYIRSLPGNKVILFESRGMEKAMNMLKVSL